MTTMPMYRTRFMDHFTRSLELLPEETRELFTTALIGSMHLFLTEETGVKCIAMALDIAQDNSLLEVKGNA